MAIGRYIWLIRVLIRVMRLIADRFDKPGGPEELDRALNGDK